MEPSRESTPKKISEYISPLFSSKYCVVCQTGIDTLKNAKDNVLKLWKNDVEKTSAGRNVELNLDVTLTETDFKVLCKSCHSCIQTALGNQEKREKTRYQGRKDTLEKYLCRSVKSGLPSDTVLTSESKRAREIVREKRKLDLHATDGIPCQLFLNKSNNFFEAKRTECTMVVSI